MADELGSETREDMKRLCKKISVAHKLDAEIQEELYAHMEDKLIAYLDGEERIAEKDAFILVREHFGKASVVKGLMPDAHKFEANVSLARRLGAVLITTLSVTVVGRCSVTALALLWQAVGGFSYGIVLILSVIGPLSVVIPWLLLRHWQSRLDAGHMPWFITIRPLYFVAWTAALLVLQGLLAFRPAHPILQCMMWLWWSDRPPRKAWAVVNAATLWLMWSCISASLIFTFKIIVEGLPLGVSRVPSNIQILESYYLQVLKWVLIAFALYRLPRYSRTGYALWIKTFR